LPAEAPNYYNFEEGVALLEVTIFNNNERVIVIEIEIEFMIVIVIVIVIEIAIVLRWPEVKSFLEVVIKI
jgi:hypothetical protein